MLRVTFTAGDKPQRWLFDPDEVDMDEAERIEDALGSGRTWDDFVRGLLNNSIAVRRVLLWHLLRRENPGYDLPLIDVPNIKVGQLEVELGSKELRQLITDAEESLLIPPARRKRMVVNLEGFLAEALAAEAEIMASAVDSDPKEPMPAAAGIIPAAESPDPMPPSGLSETAS